MQTLSGLGQNRRKFNEFRRGLTLVTRLQVGSLQSSGLWLIPKICPEGQRLTCGPTLPIRCVPGTDLVLLIAYTCPYNLKINISSFLFLNFWQGDSRKSQDVASAVCSVPRQADQAAKISECCWM